MSGGTLAGSGRLGEIFLIHVDEEPARTEIVLDPEAEAPVALSRPPSFYAWPTWSGDGEALLLSSVETLGTRSPQSQVLRYGLQDQAVQMLFSNPRSSGLIAPGVAHYLNPSRDGQHLVLVAQFGRGSLSLVYVDAKGRGPGRMLARGAPIFTSWSPASDALLLHVGGELSLMEIETAPSMQLFASNHVGYRTPAWSPDGTRIAVPAQEGPRLSLLLLDRNGKTLQALTPSWPAAALAWSPDGAYIAHAQMAAREPAHYAHLELVDPSGGGVRPLLSAPFRAYFWSPKGDTIALLAPQARPDQCAWQVVDLVGKTVAVSAPFIPSAEMSLMMAFFDQYGGSHRVWSPDGSMLVGAGRMQHNGTPIEQAGTQIFLFSPADGSMRTVGSGGLATWSPVAQA